ncbi:MAG: serine hydrolase, partial [Verrucomicrobiales bacterium]|nr:serine hydrolase [Verrucomicrobiales bacterium]
MKFRCFSISSFLALASLLTLTAPAQTETLPGKLAVLDRDKDNRISREEAGERPFFAALDRDKDGFITAAEAAKVMNRSAASKTTPAEPAAFAADAATFKKAADYSAENNGRAVLIMRKGEIVFERYDNGFNAETSTRLHSATKAFWGPVIASMIEDGLIDSFDELASKTLTEWANHPRKSRITLRHLLTLSAGLVQDVEKLQGEDRDTLAPDLYRHAIGVQAAREPGAQFQYGPSCFYVLGEIMKRKLASKTQTPLDYLKQRILDPIGVKTGEWVQDAAGNPHIPNGAHLTAREWAKYGQWLLQTGEWQGKQIVRKDLLQELRAPSSANPGHGLALWLNHPEGQGSSPLQKTPEGAPGGWIFH